MSLRSSPAERQGSNTGEEPVVSAAPSQAIQHVDQLPQAAIIAAVEAERDSRQLHKLVVLPLFRRGLDNLDFFAIHDVGEILVQSGDGGRRRNVFQSDDEQ